MSDYDSPTGREARAKGEIVTDHWRRGFLTSLGVALAATILIGFAAPTVGAEEKDKKCPYAGQKLDDPEILKRILEAHAAWLKDMTGKGRAYLCHANLYNADLRGANLFGADLEGAFLVSAKLQKANLTSAKLQKANLARAILLGANLVGAQLQGANLVGAQLQKANLVGARLQGANLSRAKLQGANLVGAQLQGAELREANLQGAELREANLQNAILEATNLASVNFEKADLRGANLQYSELSGATFPKSKLSSASFLGVNVRDLKDFEPLAPKDFPEGLVSVREQFKKAGDREEERYLTHLIKRNERRTAPVIESAFSYILFEATSDWGFAPGRPLLILVVLIAGFSLFYMQAILVPEPEKYGIFRFWPDAKERVKDYNEQKEPERIEVSDFNELRMLGWGLYFSVLSAFHIGWRDLNVGSWIVRVQTREYTLRATGWVRVVSGIQSLISVYLLALWALVYFGRPFE